MSFLLCRQCYTWVDPPEDGRCPECERIIDSGMPDPPLHKLQAEIGEIVSRAGEVRVQRKMLPDQGMLYVTTEGLFFLPHRLEQVPRMVESTADTAAIMWSLAAVAWTPLALVLPLMRSKRRTIGSVPVFRPQLITRDQSRLLPVLLMENPGVFFVPRNSIRIISRRHHTWRLERWQGTPIMLKAIGNRLRLQMRIEALLSEGS